MLAASIKAMDKRRMKEAAASEKKSKKERHNKDPQAMMKKAVNGIINGVRSRDEKYHVTEK